MFIFFSFVADIILGYNTEKIVFWHHGYETILKIVNLTSISKSIFSPEKFSTQCVWARMDSCGSKVSYYYFIKHHYQNELQEFL